MMTRYPKMRSSGAWSETLCITFIFSSAITRSSMSFTFLDFHVQRGQALVDALVHDELLRVGDVAAVLGYHAGDVAEHAGLVLAEHVSIAVLPASAVLREKIRS